MKKSTAEPQTRHHELCFGCGRTNLFGLMLEATPDRPGAMKARCFVKQDHQGPVPGQAHPGIVACALLEAMLLAGGPGAEAARVEITPEPGASVAVGCFIDVEAMVMLHGKATVAARAVASVEAQVVARGTAQLVIRDRAHGASS